MKDAALARGHGREGEGAAGGVHLFDSHLGHEVEFTVAGSLESLGVEVDLIVLFGFEAKDLGGDVFDCVEEFAVSGQQEGSVRAAEFDSDLGVGYRRRKVRRDRLGCTG
jgi:hypothetical protein